MSRESLGSRTRISHRTGSMTGEPRTPVGGNPLQIGPRAPAQPGARYWRAMSQDDVDLARRAFDALGRHDIEGFLAFVDPDVVFTSLVLEAEGGVYRGHDGVRDWWRSLSSVFPDWRPEVQEVRQLGEHEVLICIRMRAQGMASRVAVDQTTWQVARSREGKVVEWHFYRTETEAMKAVELRD
jgi:ketosteroid isomerase-like protein